MFYETFTEAEAAYAAALRKQTSSFCPFIGGSCRDDCVCFRAEDPFEVTISRGGKDTRVWKIAPAECTNLLVYGVE